MKVEALSDWHGELIHNGKTVGYLYKTKEGYIAEVNYKRYTIKNTDSKHLIQWLEAIMQGDVNEWVAERYAKKRGFKILF